MKYGRNRLAEVDLKAKNYSENPYPDGWEKVTVPEGVSGAWRVECFTVPTDHLMTDLMNLRAIRDGFWHRVVPPGEYTRLMRRDARPNGKHKDVVVMSDTPAEAHDHDKLYRAARGRVLVNGLGLGFALKAILAKPEVECVTVVEHSEDVLNLVAPTFLGFAWDQRMASAVSVINRERVYFIHADATQWRPVQSEKFDVVWHDIWDQISDGNLPQIKELKAAYKHRGRWQGAWSEEYLR